MYNIIILLSVVAILSCGEVKKKSPESLKRSQMVELQNNLISNIKTKDAWIGRDCDGLLWNSLARVGGVAVNLQLAEYEFGAWHRRPAPACWDGKDNGSKSTTSNDMMTGLLIALWHTLDTAAMERLYDYGNANDWVMGEPFPEQIFRVVLRSNGRYLLAKMIDNLDGTKHIRDLLQPNVYFPVQKDFEKHLMALGIYLSGEVDNQINDQMLKRLKELVKSDPNDALFNAILGMYDDQKYMDKAIELLSADEYIVPSYVRGDKQYPNVHMLFVTQIILRNIL